MCNKETLVERRIEERNNSNESLAEKLMREAGGSMEDLKPEQEKPEGEDGKVKKSVLPVCWACNGEKQVKGLFGKSDCFNCDGTGYDNGDPIAIIKKQQEWLEWSRKQIVALRRENKRLDPRTDEEKHADAVGEFYSDSKRNKHD